MNEISHIVGVEKFDVKKEIEDEKNLFLKSDIAENNDEIGVEVEIEDESRLPLESAFTEEKLFELLKFRLFIVDGIKSENLSPTEIFIKACRKNYFDLRIYFVPDNISLIKSAEKIILNSEMLKDIFKTNNSEAIEFILKMDIKPEILCVKLLDNMRKFHSTNVLVFLNIFIAHGFDIKKFRYLNGKTLLHIAVILGNLDLVKFIYTHFPDLLNTLDNLEQTPLMFAASAGNEAIAKYLLEQESVELEATTSFPIRHPHHGKTALWYAIGKKNTVIVQELMLKGAKVSIYDFIKAKGKMKKVLRDGLKKSNRYKAFVREIIKMNLDGWLEPENFPDEFMLKDLEILKWLLDKLDEKLNISDNNNLSMIEENDSDEESTEAATEGNESETNPDEIDISESKFKIKKTKSWTLFGLTPNDTLTNSLSKRLEKYFNSQFNCHQFKVSFSAEEKKIIVFINNLLKNYVANSHLKEYFKPNIFHILPDNTPNFYIPLLIKANIDINAIDNFGHTPVMTGVKQGKFKLATLLLNNGAKLSLAYPAPKTNLFFLLPDNTPQEFISLLISKGLDINATDKYDNTPLIAAVKQGKYNLARLLLDNGANPDELKLLNAPDKNGMTLLMYAIFNNQIDRVKFLLTQPDLNLDVVIPGSEEYNEYQRKTLIHCALQNEYLEIIQALVSKGARILISDIINSKDNIKKAMLESLENSPKLEEFLKERIGQIKVTWLHEASYTNDLITVKWILAQLEKINLKENINIKSASGDTPLMLAVFCGNKAVVDCLLAQTHIDIYLRQGQSKTALDIAIEKENSEIITEITQAFVSKGTKPLDIYHIFVIHAKDTVKKALLKGLEKSSKLKKILRKNTLGILQLTWLNYAARGGDLETVKWIIAQFNKFNLQQNINERGKQDFTPLMWAVSFGHEAVFDCLLEEAYIDIEVFDRNKKTALNFAIEKKHEAMIEKLILAGAKVPLKYISQIYSGKERKILMKVLHKLGKLKSIINQPMDDLGNTWLHHAVKSNSLTTVKWLLKNDADIDTRNEKHETPLHTAIISQNLNIVQLLLNPPKIRPADINAVDYLGNTTAIHAVQSGNLEILKLIIEKNKSLLSQPNDSGMMPLDYAMLQYDQYMLFYLCTSGAKSKDASIKVVLNVRGPVEIYTQNPEKTDKSSDSFSYNDNYPKAAFFPSAVRVAQELLPAPVNTTKDNYLRSDDSVVNIFNTLSSLFKY